MILTDTVLTIWNSVKIGGNPALYKQAEKGYTC